MDIDLPGVRGLFSHMQEALRHMEGKGVTMTKGVYQALTDFRWLADNLSRCPTIMYELVPLQPTLDSDHNVSGYMCKGAVLPGPTAVTWTPQKKPSVAVTSPETAGAQPIVWRKNFTAEIIAQMISWGNLEGQVTNSDLDMAVSVIQHACMADCFDIHKWNTLSCTDNTAGLW